MNLGFSIYSLGFWLLLSTYPPISMFLWKQVFEEQFLQIVISFMKNQMISHTKVAKRRKAKLLKNGRLE